MLVSGKNHPVGRQPERNEQALRPPRGQILGSTSKFDSVETVQLRQEMQLILACTKYCLKRANPSGGKELGMGMEPSGAITALLVGATPDSREWVSVQAGSVRVLDPWHKRVSFVDLRGEEWIVPGRDGTIAGFRRGSSGRAGPRGGLNLSISL
jgi:hypothetical protein